MVSVNIYERLIYVVFSITGASMAGLSPNNRFEVFGKPPFLDPFHQIMYDFYIAPNSHLI
jgi:hypothetical protein